MFVSVLGLVRAAGLSGTDLLAMAPVHVTSVTCLLSTACSVVCDVGL